MMLVNRLPTIRPRWLSAGCVLPVAALVLVGTGPTAQAQDASFGCKVLLCAAATAPGWAGIPYCVPVIQQLFTQLARRGGSWPICAEAQASGIGFEPYKACPIGLTPIGDGATSPEDAQGAALCADLTKPQQVCDGGDGTCRTTYPTIAREPRDQPNYVDLTTAGGAQRFYFSLRGY